MVSILETIIMEKSIESIISPSNHAAMIWEDLDSGKTYLFTTNNINKPKKYELTDGGDFKFIGYFEADNTNV